MKTKNAQIILGFCFFLFLISSRSNAQTLGPYQLDGYLSDATHPAGCTNNHVLYWPQDSGWVNFASGQIMTGTFNATSSDKTGYDMILESAFNLDSYDVRLKLTSGSYSSMHRVNFSDWTLDTAVYIEYITPTCLRGGPYPTQRYYLALDFDADFNLSSTDIVEGIEITFLAPDGNIDFSGAYIIQGALTPIRKVPNTELVQIAPNPASSTIQVLNLPPPFSYSIYNNLGQPIKQNTITTSNTLNIGNLPASFYYLYIAKENENHVIKFMKY